MKGPKLRQLANDLAVLLQDNFWAEKVSGREAHLNYLILNLYGPIEQADDCGVAEQLLLGL